MITISTFNSLLCHVGSFGYNCDLSCDSYYDYDCDGDSDYDCNGDRAMDVKITVTSSLTLTVSVTTIINTSEVTAGCSRQCNKMVQTHSDHIACKLSQVFEPTSLLSNSLLPAS